VGWLRPGRDCWPQRRECGDGGADESALRSRPEPLATQRLEQLDAADSTDAKIKAATRLGAPFKIYADDVNPFRVEVAKRLAAEQAAAGHQGNPLSPSDRARVRTEVARDFFRGEHGRDPFDAREIAGTITKASRQRTQTVAGYDLTFSPVKGL
jgi:hypothetical protein